MNAGFTDPSFSNDDPMDGLLRQAQWPEPSEAALSRLSQRWQAASKRRRREMFALRAAAVAVAATLLVAASVIGWRMLRPGDQVVAQPKNRQPEPAPRSVEPTPQPIATNPGQVLQTVHRPNSPIGAPSARGAKSPTRSAADDPLAAWRPPNELEQLMVAAWDRRAKAHATRPRPAGNVKPRGTSKPKAQVTAVKPRLSRLTGIVNRLASDPKADAAALAATLEAAPEAAERELLELLRHGNGAQQLAALRLLAEIGGPRCVPDVLAMLARPDLHAAGVSVLARVADPALINSLVWSEENARLRPVLLRGLLSRGDGAALEMYLDFVCRPETEDAAMAAADQVKNAPMELLFAFLQSTVEPQRIAAARVIGRIDGPVATRRLIAMIDQGTSRQEACVALLSSRGDDAVRFVKMAQRDPALLSLFQAARLFVSNQPLARSEL